MGGFQLYSFFLCLIVFIALTGLFSFMIVYIGKQKATLISNGLEDAQIKEKVLQKLNKGSTKTNKVVEIIKKVVSILLCVFLCILLVVAGISSCRGDNRVKSIPAIKVIASTSMSEKYEKNTYLFKYIL